MDFTIRRENVLNVSGFHSFFDGILSRRLGLAKRRGTQIGFRRAQHNEITVLAQRDFNPESYTPVSKTFDFFYTIPSSFVQLSTQGRIGPSRIGKIHPHIISVHMFPSALKIWRVWAVTWHISRTSAGYWLSHLKRFIFTKV